VAPASRRRPRVIKRERAALVRAEPDRAQEGRAVTFELTTEDITMASTSPTSRGGDIIPGKTTRVDLTPDKTRHVHVHNATSSAATDEGMSGTLVVTP
jgi:heme/copper-type cytochrome/quinol oxidase subunit 2